MFSEAPNVNVLIENELECANTIFNKSEPSPADVEEMDDQEMGDLWIWHDHGAATRGHFWLEANEGDEYDITEDPDSVPESESG